jgi:hypothetical protein
MMMTETREIRIKRLRMRAWHRGIKEMDLILGGWADSGIWQAPTTPRWTPSRPCWPRPITTFIPGSPVSPSRPRRWPRCWAGSPQNSDLRSFNGIFPFCRLSPSQASVSENIMSMHAPLASDKTGFLAGYLDTLSMVERLHRLLLDVIKDEFERVGVLDINAVQALAAVQYRRQRGDGGRIEDARLLPGLQCQLQSQEAGGDGLHAPPALRDRPPLRARAPDRKGPGRPRHVAELFARHAEGLERQGVLEADGLDRVNHSLKRVERFWSDQIRYIY